MATKAMQSIAEQLNAAQLLITNTLADAEIQSLMAAYGYDAEKVNEGKALYDSAASRVGEKTRCEGAQRAATAQLQSAEKEARDAYQALSQIARAAFGKDKAKLAALGLDRPAPRDTAGFIASANTLFINALSDTAIKTALAGYKYTPERLTSEQAKISAYDSANQRQEAAKGATQQATDEQQAALTKLNEWRAACCRVAKVALRGKPQLLEKIGIPARTGKTAAQRAAPAKAAATRAKKNAPQ